MYVVTRWLAEQMKLVENCLRFKITADAILRLVSVIPRVLKTPKLIWVIPQDVSFGNVKVEFNLCDSA